MHRGEIKMISKPLKIYSTEHQEMPIYVISFFIHQIGKLAKEGRYSVLARTWEVSFTIVEKCKF